jgi:hypothetical protein
MAEESRVTLSVTGGFDDAAALDAELDSEPDLRRHVRRVAADSPPGSLGGELPQLLVTLASGGLATALASVIVVWLRQRTGSITIRVTRADGSELELAAERVKKMDHETLRAQTDQLRALLWPEDGV